MLQKIVNHFLSAIHTLWDIYYGLSLRIKFILLIGFITLFLIFTLSIAVLESQKNILKEKVEEVCKVSVQNLSGVAKDNLLTNRYAPIQDVINNMKRLNLNGFEYAYVVNRNGLIVAHSDPKRIMERDTSFYTYLNNKEELIVNRQYNRSEYLQVLTQITPDQNDSLRYVPIGIAGVSFSHSNIQTAFKKASRAILLITLAIILFSVLLVWLVARRLSRDIIILADGARKISRGDLDVNIRINTADEIGLLAREFNKMVKSLREKLRMQKFVSRLTVDMIHSQSEQHEPEAAGSIQKKEIAVLFTDIRGFTKLSEKLEPEQLVLIVNIYLKMQSRFIEENGGVIDKFAGDEMMAIFQNEDAANSAVKAAISIQKQITKINKIRRKNNQEILTVGIGINYGTAMIGSMGTSSRMDYTAIGDVVNLASKLCNYARAGHIIVTKNVIKYLNGAFSVVKMEPIILSGRKRPIQIYRIDYT